MYLVRVAQVLKVNRIAQVSFAEYHSKRNFVERVYAQENKVLSAHGLFSSTPLHAHSKPGTREHRENMAKVVEEIKSCLRQATFGARPLICHRGVTPEEFIFTDELHLKNFLELTEEMKERFPHSVYSPSHNGLWTNLGATWSLNEDFVGDYKSDHAIIQCTYADHRTCKYSVCVYSTTPQISRNFELQPLPDFTYWLETKKLHYLCYEQRREVKYGPWDTIPGLFIPSSILELTFKVIPEPPDKVMKLIALLAWVPESRCERIPCKMEEKHATGH